MPATTPGCGEEFAEPYEEGTVAKELLPLCREWRKGIVGIVRMVCGVSRMAMRLECGSWGGCQEWRGSQMFGIAGDE